MKTIKYVGLALVLLPGLVLAQKKDKKPKVDEAINKAHTVYVQAADGEATKAGLAKEDVQAIANVRAVLRQWGRYTFTDDRSAADLILVVHTAKHRVNSGDDGFGRGTQGSGTGMGANRSDMPAPQGGQFPGQGRESVGGVNDVSTFDFDRLEVCQLKPNGKLTGALWSRSMEDGLAPPRLLLFAQFRAEVETAYPIPAADEQPAAK